MSDQTIHNATSLDWVVIDWIGENRTVSASAMTWLEWHEELLELRAERDALAAEIANLRTDAEYNAKFFDEYCAGEEAYTEGRKLTENPHESGTMPHEAWESGWCSSDWFRLTTENDRLRRRWNHVAGLAQTMGLKMDGQNSWRFQPLYHGRGPTIEAAVDDAIEKTQTEPCPDCDGHGQRWSGEGTAVTGGICRTCCGRGTVPQKARDA